MLAPKWPRHHRRAFLYIIILCIIASLCIILRHDLARNHYVSTELALRTFSPDAGEQVLWSLDEARSECHSHKFAFDENRQNGRKVYDLFLFSIELDWLEIRLQTLAPYVDYFVIVESPTTFTGKPKPLYLKDNWERFKAFHNQIIHRIVNDEINSRRVWDHEDFLRNSLLESVFPDLIGTGREANPGDALIVSDVNEIIRPGVMLLLRHCSIPARLTLHTHFYYYSFQWRHRGSQWAHPDVTIYQYSGTLPPNNLRQGLLGDGWAAIASVRRWWDRGTLWNAGWHCSSCFATLAEVRRKMDGFSHQAWNTAENRDWTNMAHRIKDGTDLFGRTGEKYDKVENNTDIPSYILEHPDRFGYLLDCDGKDTGFGDSTETHEDGV